MTPIDTAELERHADTERNRIINRCSADLESIVNGHDPEIHNLNVRVWDRLDRMAVEIEQHLAHRKAEAWQPISSAPKGCITEDAGCRGPSEWFLGRVSPEFRAGRPPFIVIRRKAWPQGHSWECAGEAWYVPRFFDAWRPLPTTPEAEGGCDD